MLQRLSCCRSRVRRVLGADAAGEDGVEEAVVAGDLEEAAGVEAGGDAGVAAGLVDADALAVDPGGDAGEAVQEAEIGGGEGAAELALEGVELVVEGEQEVLDEELAGVGGAARSRRRLVASGASSGGNSAWLRLMPMPMTAKRRCAGRPGCAGVEALSTRMPPTFFPFRRRSLGQRMSAVRPEVCWMARCAARPVEREIQRASARGMGVCGRMRALR